MTNSDFKSLVLGTFDAFNELKRSKYLLDFFWDCVEEYYPILCFEVDSQKRFEAFDRLSYVITLYEKESLQSLSCLEYSLNQLKKLYQENLNSEV